MMQHKLSLLAFLSVFFVVKVIIAYFTKHFNTEIQIQKAHPKFPSDVMLKNINLQNRPFYPFEIRTVSLKTFSILHYVTFNLLARTNNK